MKKSFLFFVLTLSSAKIFTSCPDTTPWSTPVNLSNTGQVRSITISAGTSAGFMTTWRNNSAAESVFSSNGTTWGSPQSIVGSGVNSDVWVAGNSNGFVATWGNGSNGFSKFYNGSSWGSLEQVASNMFSDTDVAIAGSDAGFVAAWIGNDNNAYASYSDGTSGWLVSPVQITNDGLVSTSPGLNYGRPFISVAVVGSTAMVVWTKTNGNTYSAFFSSINPLSSSPSINPVLIGRGVATPAVVAGTSAGYMAVALTSGHETYASFSSNSGSTWNSVQVYANPYDTPWVSGNGAGFMSTWISNTVGYAQASPVWAFSSDNGVDWTSACSILASLSTSVLGPVAVSGTNAGFVATWTDGADLNAYASFTNQFVPPPTPSFVSSSSFVNVLLQKYGPLL